MSDMPLRAPLRPLSQILPARDRGENPDIIERKNIELRHETQRDPARARAQGRLLVLGIMFICIFAVITVRIGLLSASEPIEPRSQKAGASIIAQRADIVDGRPDAMVGTCALGGGHAQPAYSLGPGNVRSGRHAARAG